MKVKDFTVDELKKICNHYHNKNSKCKDGCPFTKDDSDCCIRAIDGTVVANAEAQNLYIPIETVYEVFGKAYKPAGCKSFAEEAYISHINLQKDLNPKSIFENAPNIKEETVEYSETDAKTTETVLKTANMNLDDYNVYGSKLADVKEINRLKEENLELKLIIGELQHKIFKLEKDKE